ncbi:MAG: murein biosynthesis integral membrane protein MurJ [Sneathiella sp.]|uniref:murein biosynthesis integral membrane protein MurJ n=1 Tax=Sneathiella sp. TaxID=1964365 RepID=UPI000C479844|nr:murein biosynthesis integral membrane protein MurJ [Sneathiella sp.]MAL79062.1 murein biosynthesis integral membrane protein MurJ [Sneathiella sp.]
MSLLKSVATVGGYTMISRVLGFLRDILMAAILGAGPVADAFLVAFRIPNMFRRLVAEGAFSAAFIPLFARKLEQEGKDMALEFASHALSILVGFLLIFSALFMIFMPFMMQFLAPGFGTEGLRFELAVDFTRITFPYLLAMAIVALLGGVLNAFYKFAAMAAAPILLNIVLIAFLLFGIGKTESDVGLLLSVGVALAGLAQVVFLVIACKRTGARVPLRRPVFNADIRRLFRLMLPGILGAGVMQINILVGTIIASYLATGAISYLYYADRVYQLPLGVIGIAVGTALLPMLSRQLRSGEETTALYSMNRALELALLLTLPATAALMVIPEEIISALFRHGEFTAAASEATAMALFAFASGLPAYVLVKIFAPGFFAREDTTTPVIVGVIAMILNVSLSLLLIQSFGHVGIALATSLSSWFNVMALFIILRRRGHYAADARLLRRLVGIFLASLVMAAGLYVARRYLDGLLADDLAARITLLALLVGGGMVLYALAILAFGGAKPKEVKNMLKRRPSK